MLEPMTPTDRRHRLQRLLDALPGEPAWLVEHSPGDGKTRYALVKGMPDYDGGWRIGWAVGLREAERMVEMYVRGRQDGWDDAEEGLEVCTVEGFQDRDFRAEDVRTALRVALDLAEEVVEIARWRTPALANATRAARNALDDWDRVEALRKDGEKILLRLLRAIREDYLPDRRVGWNGHILFVEREDEE